MKTVVVVLVSLMVALPAAFGQLQADPPAGKTVSTGFETVPQKQVPALRDWTVAGSIQTFISNPTGLTYDGQNLLVADWTASTAAPIYTVDPASGATINFIMGPSNWPCGMTWDGANIWLSDYLGGSQMFKLNPNTGAVLAMYSIPYSYYCAGTAWDGQYIYFGVNAYTGPEADYIYKLDPNTGAVLGSITIPSTYISGLTYHDGHLWYADRMEHVIYKITTSGVIVDSSPAQGDYPAGLTFANGYLYNVDKTTAIIYQYDITPPEVEIMLTPYNPPIVIPAGGGMFEFNIEVTNIGTSPGTADIWTMITLPNGNVFGPIMNVQNLPMAAGWSGNRDRNQAIPVGAPSGDYTYDAYIGAYPTGIWAEDHFDFAKSATDDGSGFIYGWACSGEGFGGEAPSTAAVPVVHRLLTAYPNPFNNQTEINFELADAGFVELTVFDVTGREAASLVNGHLSAGLHDVTWNAEGMTSGVYFVSLETSGARQVQKVLLVK